MPAASKKSYGSIPQARARKLLQAILEVVDQADRGCGLKFNADWAEGSSPRLTIETTLQALTLIAHPNLKANTPEFKKAKNQTGEALGDLRDFVGILEDHRTQKKGSDKWHFSLRLWGKAVECNLEGFDQAWESQRSSNSKTQTTTQTTTQKPTQSLMKPGAPRPPVQLPENFVERPEALAAVKDLLLRESERTLVVSAIAGLGGLGKSVLATAIVLDDEVQARFADGILWVTLGQQPDLLGLVGEWIRALDKSRESWSATTLEAARGYLHNLLVEKRMLLVVDDVWNADHAEWFRVGGAGCRVLVTTREAAIEGADYYPLDLMTEAEAIDLVRGKLKRQWRDEQAAAVRQFARVVGYLPLALDLSANLVRDGMRWEELQAEFEDERKAVALELLDASEAFENLPEERQRKYSLKACFNLSLRRLSPEQLRRFAWLGVLPEDARIDARMVGTLWDVSEVVAKKGLIDLFRRSFLTSAGESVEGYALYRVHDLMHDTARGLIVGGCLAGIEGLAAAHRSFVGRYGKLDAEAYLFGLPKDGYIHRHLTWHLVMAGREDAVHRLLQRSDLLGRNAWFEACEEIGEPAIFVQDVQRGWELAEALYERDPERSIVLQGRYALMTATLNSLLDNLPAGVMAEFVKDGFWPVDRAWAYVEQIQDEEKITEAIKALAVYLTKPLFLVALDKVRLIQDENRRSEAWRALAQNDSADFSQRLAVARAIQDQSSRAWVLSDLARIDSAYLSEALAAARTIQSPYLRTDVLSNLARIDASYFSEALAVTRSIPFQHFCDEALNKLARIDSADFSQRLVAARLIQDNGTRAEILSALAQIDSAYFPEALATARIIQDEYFRAKVLTQLAQIDSAYFSEALKSAQCIKNGYLYVTVLSDLARIDSTYVFKVLVAARSRLSKYFCARVLSNLAQINSAYFPEALATARIIQDEYFRAEVLSDLARIDSAYFSEALIAARTIQDDDSRAKVLTQLAQVDSAYFSEALAVAQLIQDDDSHAEVLTQLAQVDSAYFSEVLAAVGKIQDEYRRVEVLSNLAQIDSAYFSEALAAVGKIQEKNFRIAVLSNLARVESADFSQLLAAVRAIRDEDNRAKALSQLAQIDSAYFSEALVAVRSMPSEYRRTEILSQLAQIDSANFYQLLETVQSIQFEPSRARVLNILAQIDSTDFSQLLEAVRLIQDNDTRAEILSVLAQIDSAYFFEALEAARMIRSEYRRAAVLSDLTRVDSADFSQLLDAARTILDDDSRTAVLSDLARVGSASFSQRLTAVRSIRDDDSRAAVLGNLTQINSAHLPQHLAAAKSTWFEKTRASSALSKLANSGLQTALSQIDRSLIKITHLPTRAQSLSSYLPRLPLASLSLTDWQTYLHLLAHRTRSDLMEDLVTLYPAILHLGGEGTMRGIVEEMKRICRQWP